MPGGVWRRPAQPAHTVQRRQAALLEALADGMNLARACRLVGTQRGSVWEWRKDPWFEAALQDARARGDRRLSYEAWWSAVDLDRVAPHPGAAARAEPISGMVIGAIGRASLREIVDAVRRAAAGAEGAGAPKPAAVSGTAAAPRRPPSPWPPLDATLRRLIDEAVSIGLP